jgi:hypothetical protein
MNELVQMGFNYEALDEATREFVQQKTDEIHGQLKRTAEGIIKIGQNLIAVKERLEREYGRGKYEGWLKTEFDMSHSAAKRFMQVARRFGNEGTKLVPSFPNSVLYELAAPSTSDTVVQQVQSGDVSPTLDAIKKAKQIEREALEKAKQAEDRAKQIEKESQLALLQSDDRINEAQEQLSLFEEQQDINRAEIARLTGMIADLEAAEPQVVTQEVQVVPPEVKSELEAVRKRVKELESKQQALKAERDQKEERVKVLTNELRSYAEVDQQEKHNEQVRTKWRQACEAFHQGLNQGFIRMVSPIDAQQAFESDEWARLAELETTLKQALERLAYLRESITSQFVEASIIEG